VPLALNHDENRGYNDQNQKNPHASTLPGLRGRKIYDGAANKKGRWKNSADFHRAVILPARRRPHMLERNQALGALFGLPGRTPRRQEQSAASYAL
jgi:hypothetical protein